MGDEP